MLATEADENRSPDLPPISERSRNGQANIHAQWLRKSDSQIIEMRMFFGYLKSSLVLYHAVILVQACGDNMIRFTTNKKMISKRTAL